MTNPVEFPARIAVYAANVEDALEEIESLIRGLSKGDSGVLLAVEHTPIADESERWFDIAEDD